MRGLGIRLLGVTETAHSWDRLPAETPKSYSAFLAYIALGTRRSVREAARQHHVSATSAGEITGVEDTTVRTWITWSAKHKWVSRGLARDEWIARTCGRARSSSPNWRASMTVVRQAHEIPASRTDMLKSGFAGRRASRTVIPGGSAALRT